MGVTVRTTGGHNHDRKVTVKEYGDQNQDNRKSHTVAIIIEKFRRIGSHNHTEATGW